jgi:GTPase SAR1 family protein
MLVGNKEDLEDDRKVSFDAAATYAAQHKLMYTETSAKTNHNVKIAIERVINEIYDNVSGSSSLSRDTSFDTQKKKERSISYKF